MRERELVFRGGCRVGLDADRLVLVLVPLLLLVLFLVGGGVGGGVGGVVVDGGGGGKGQVVQCRR